MPIIPLLGFPFLVDRRTVFVCTVVDVLNLNDVPSNFSVTLVVLLDRFVASEKRSVTSSFNT